uniref:t-SNARE coiled-coil homology domain-containing protein n=2 Tax=Timema TaxID=61471 RepID=A0A7R9FIT0_9NEOP|nr:unnamed protein product [Timema bartmani]CAD7453996.1 unnamed protein product [Timema tahoe]
MSRGPPIGGQKSYGSMNTNVPNVGFAGGVQFSPTELYNLSENITTNIYTINTNWKNLERALKSIGTERDNQGLRDQVHVTQLSCNQIVAQTTKDLQRLNVVVRRGDKQQKLQVEKLTNDFKEALQCYSKLQTKVAEKMKVSLLKRQSSQSGAYNEDDENQLLEEEEGIAAQKALQKELVFENEMLAEREQRVRQIEDDILDVNHIMRELSAMVYEQADTVNSIENNIESVHSNVELGADQLQIASQYQNKYRRKLCILAALAAIVGIALVIILVTQLKR